MRQLILGLAALTLCSVEVGQARAGQVTVDFDNLQGMTYISGNPVPSYAVLTDQYANLGVLFQNTAVVELGGTSVSPPNAIGGISPSGTLTYSSHYPQIQFSFFVGDTAATTDFVSIRGDIVGDSRRSQTLSAFDLAGNLVGSSTVFDTGGQTYSIQAEGIHLVTWSGVDIRDDEGGGVALDHLVFDQPVGTVPEPATITLLGIAIAGMAGYTWKRRKFGLV